MLPSLSRPLPVLALLGGLFLPHLASAQAPIRIMPLGDSITYGEGAAGGYRDKLYQTLTTAGYNVDFVGNESNNGTGTLPDSDHEGHSGWRIDQLDSNIEGWFGAIEGPDVILLHIGTNDFGQNNDTPNAINRLDALITKMATLRPYAHIIVTNLLERGEPENTKIQNEFNPFVQTTVNVQAGLGRRVTYLDMRSVVPLSDMPDNLHPNQIGYGKMADAWLPAIQAVTGPEGDSFAPEIVQARGDGDLLHVAITFSKPVADSAATVGNYAINGGLTVSAATLDASKRVVTLTTSLQTIGSNYTVTVNNVVDRTVGMLALPVNSMVDFFGVTQRGYLNNVPESSAYTLAYSLEIPTVANYGVAAVSYEVDNHTLFNSFDRVAYYLELQNATDDLQYVWASVDAFTTDSGQIGVPTATSGAIFQQLVTGMNVVSNAVGITTGTGLTGNLEFWPTNYAQANALPVTGASGSIFDFGDERSGSGLYGSMQLHNAPAGQTIFAYNNWGNNGSQGNGDLGIGNDLTPGDGSSDWTFSNNAGIYMIKTLQVLVRTTVDTTPPTLDLATRFEGTKVMVRFSEPLAAASVQAADFSLDGGVSVISATLEANQRDVTLVTSAQPVGTPLTLTVSNVTDSSPAANEILSGSTIGVLEVVLPVGIIKLKISDIVPGTENVTLVPNGDFENNSSGNNFGPVGWDRFGNMFYDGHAGVTVPASLGANSARIHIDGGNVGNYNQNVTLTPNIDYVLSAYVWHLGDPFHTGTVELDLNDKPYEPNDGGGSISLTQDDADADQGYFVYAAFNPGSDTLVNLRAFMVFSGNSGWPNQPTGALWDNIAITPASSFVAPATLNEIFVITDIAYDEGGDTFTLSWTSNAGSNYGVYYSPDLTDWTTEVAPAVSSDGGLTSFGPFPNPDPGASRGFFRIEKN